MKENVHELFIKFTKTGKITDYLKYSNEKKKQDKGNINGIYRRDSNKPKEI